MGSHLHKQKQMRRTMQGTPDNDENKQRPACRYQSRRKKGTCSQFLSLFRAKTNTSKYMLTHTQSTDCLNVSGLFIHAFLNAAPGSHHTATLYQCYAEYNKRCRHEQTACVHTSPAVSVIWYTWKKHYLIQSWIFNPTMCESTKNTVLIGH